MQRRTFLKTVATFGAVAVIGIGGASQAAPRRLRTSWHRVPLLGGPAIRVLHLTDLHLGRATSATLLQQALEQARLVHPDLVVMTGDYLNHSLRYLPELDRLLDQVPRPCLATLGNHDHWSGAPIIRRTLESHGVQVLCNAHQLVQLQKGQLTVVGVDDGVTGHADPARAFAGVSEPGRALVLTHSPRTAPAIVARGGRLILCGHTHGGQLGVPHLTPALARLGGTRHLSGWHSLGAARLYVSPGIGSSFIRLRLGRMAAPEVAVLDLI